MESKVVNGARSLRATSSLQPASTVPSVQPHVSSLVHLLPPASLTTSITLALTFNLTLICRFGPHAKPSCLRALAKFLPTVKPNRSPRQAVSHAHTQNALLVAAPMVCNIALLYGSAGHT
eukprot:6197988-Pleurochrysis_carterae.AAC.2